MVTPHRRSHHHGIAVSAPWQLERPRTYVVTIKEGLQSPALVRVPRGAPLLAVHQLGARLEGDAGKIEMLPPCPAVCPCPRLSVFHLDRIAIPA